MRTALDQGPEEDAETTALRNVPISQLFAYKALLENGEPDIWGDVGVNGWKVKLRTDVSPGPGSALPRRGSPAGVLSPATCAKASRVFVKNHHKTQIKKEGVLARVAKFIQDMITAQAASVAEGESDEEESEEEEEEDDRPEDSDLCARYQESFSSSSSSVLKLEPKNDGVLAALNLDGPRGKPEILAPQRFEV